MTLTTGDQPDTPAPRTEMPAVQAGTADCRRLALQVAAERFGGRPPIEELAAAPERQARP